MYIHIHIAYYQGLVGFVIYEYHLLTFSLYRKIYLTQRLPNMLKYRFRNLVHVPPFQVTRVIHYTFTLRAFYVAS